MRILIAEDDSVSQKLLVKILAEQGHEPVIFNDGRSALESFKLKPTRVVISDWMMPEMDGVALCRAIRALNLPEYTHFIMLTAKTGSDNYRFAMSRGVDDFLPKPVNKEDLVIKLRVTERVIEQRKNAEKQIRALARFPEDNPNPVLQADAEGRILYVNRASRSLMDEWGRRPGDLLPDKLRALLADDARHGARVEAEITCGDQVFSFRVTSVYEGETTYLYGHNVTEMKRAESELMMLKDQAVQASLHDQLTGLPNRILLQDRLSHDMARCRRQGTRMALVMVDIDNFKTINDSQGHQIGDKVLVLVSQCLQQQLRESDTVCRWGGDELILLLSDLKDGGEAPRIMEKINLALQQAVARASLAVPVTLSLGYSLFPDNASEPDLLMQQADHALYLAKAEGRNCWRQFSGFGQGGEIKSRADLYLRLSEAVRQQRIEVHYQPILEASSGRLVGLEALARWKDAQAGWVSPDVFIPMAEDRGLILPLGQQVTRAALERVRALRGRGLPLTVSINLAKTQLLDPAFLPWLAASAARLGVEPSWVVLEVTERQSLLNHAGSRERLEALAEAGFRLSLDDFGTGYASLDMVGEMPFHELKIPRPLIRKLETPKGRRIVQAIVEMARTLQLKIVAEGVETASSLELLKAIGVHKLQGYYYSKPLAADDLDAFVASHVPAAAVPLPDKGSPADDLTLVEPKRAA